MINEDLLISQLQNGLPSQEKMKMLHQYRNYWQAAGFEIGFENCLTTMKTSQMKRKQIIEKRKNELLDQVRDEIWKQRQMLKNL